MSKKAAARKSTMQNECNRYSQCAGPWIINIFSADPMIWTYVSGKLKRALNLESSTRDSRQLSTIEKHWRINLSIIKMCKRLYERDICQSTFKMPKSVNKSTNNLSSASNKTWNSTMRQASSKQKEIRKSNRSKMYEEQHKNNYSLFLCLCWLFSKELFPVFHFTHYILTLCISPQRDVVS